jgi:hypothetical protein
MTCLLSHQVSIDEALSGLVFRSDCRVPVLERNEGLRDDR